LWKGAALYLNGEEVTELVIPEGVTSIVQYAFFGSRIMGITIPNSVSDIGVGAFEECKNLKNISIPEGVTNIGEDAFRDCENLTSITIPASMSEIGENAFYECKNLATIIFAGTLEQWYEVTLGQNWKYDISAKQIICSDGTANL
jgi:hypothetical protein